MESFGEINPKEFSINKRSKKFCCGRDKKRADANGHRLRKQYYNPLDNAYTINKFKNNTNKLDLGLTSFEENIGINITSNGVSFKNQKLFNKINSLLSLNDNTNNNNKDDSNNDDSKSNTDDENKDSNNDSSIKCFTFDEMYKVSKHGLKDNMDFIRRSNGTHLNCKRIYLAYYDINELNLKYEKQMNKEKIYNHKSGLHALNEMDNNINESKLNSYIKDKHYKRMAYRSSIVTYKSWLNTHLSMPKQIIQYKNKLRNNSSLNEFVFLLGGNKHFKYIGYRSRSYNHDCNIHRCSIKNFGTHSYWTPKQRDDSRDFLEVDLKYNYHINAVSTRGRPLKRETNKETHNYEVLPGWPVEYVKRYHLYVKMDDDSNSDDGSGNKSNGGNNKNGSNKKNKNGKKKNGNNKNNGSNNDNNNNDIMNENWIDLGEFDGNKDCETENCHILLSRRIVARYVRFVPLGRNKDGYFGRKSMRVGIYGKKVIDTTDKVDNSKISNNNNGNDGNMGENTENKDGKESKDRDFSNNEITITQSKVPSVIITIDLPSNSKNNLHSKNGYGTHVYQGIDCDCRMCSWYSRQCKQENHKKRRQLLQMSNEWKKSIKISSSNEPN